MGVSTQNLTMGPGTLFAAPFGTTEPATPTTAPVAPWVDLGGTQDGITLSSNEEFTELEVDQLVDTPERRRTKRELTIGTNLAETTLENLAITFNEPLPAVAVAGAQSFDPTLGAAAFKPGYRAILADGPAPSGGTRRIVARKVLNIDGTEWKYAKDGQNVFSVNWAAHFVSDSIKPFSIKDLTV